ncbi:MAG: prepilin-type N-terminal cleavage/methylation domain-containing protein [Planctomycetota bacterium]|jgi:prepilin-type N-terminal cleavage/methylation domain-containing protein/prepilin-type processing-associated H-X9-DG protein
MSDNRTRTTGFTLVELLIVMSVLAMLIAIVIPSMARLPELARGGVCKNTLRQLAAKVHTLGPSSRGSSVGLGYGPRLPMVDDWDVLVHRAGLSQYLFCVSSEEAAVDYSATLRDAYIRQDGGSSSSSPGVAYTYLYDALFEGNVNDPQLHYLYQGVDNGPAMDGWQWVFDLNDGNPPEDNQAMVAIATCAAVLITFTEDYIEYKPLGHSPSWQSGSQHWVGQGDPFDDDGWEDDVLVRLTGQGFATVLPAVRQKTFHETDYGMNNLVPTHTFRWGQLMLIEYNDAVVRLEGGGLDPHEPFDGNPDNGEIQDRHLGKANLVRVDGSVTSQTKVELANEFARLDSRESLWAK